LDSGVALLEDVLQEKQAASSEGAAGRTLAAGLLMGTREGGKDGKDAQVQGTGSGLTLVNRANYGTRGFWTGERVEQLRKRGTDRLGCRGNQGEAAFHHCVSAEILLKLSGAAGGHQEGQRSISHRVVRFQQEDSVLFLCRSHLVTLLEAAKHIFLRPNPI